MSKIGKETLKNRIAYCGLLCALCREDGTCDCRTSSCCGKRNLPDGCYQFNCCTSKGLTGCWECKDSPCGIDMHAPAKIKIRAFIRCMKEDGLDAFADYIISNAEKSVAYHRTGKWGEESIYGDYDLDSEESVLALLRGSSIR